MIQDMEKTTGSGNDYKPPEFEFSLPRGKHRLNESSLQKKIKLISISNMNIQNKQMYMKWKNKVYTQAKLGMTLRKTRVTNYNVQFGTYFSGNILFLFLFFRRY